MQGNHTRWRGLKTYLFCLWRFDTIQPSTVRVESFGVCFFSLINDATNSGMNGVEMIRNIQGLLGSLMTMNPDTSRFPHTTGTRKPGK